MRICDLILAYGFLLRIYTKQKKVQKELTRSTELIQK